MVFCGITKTRANFKKLWKQFGNHSFDMRPRTHAIKEMKLTSSKWKLFCIKGQHQQNGKTTYRIGDGPCKSCTWENQYVDYKRSPTNKQWTTQQTQQSN
jgi:hypothetical protein